MIYGVCVCVHFSDLVLYCEAFLTTYRTFITPEDLIKKLHYRYPLFYMRVFVCKQHCCSILFLLACMCVRALSVFAL